MPAPVAVAFTLHVTVSGRACRCCLAMSSRRFAVPVDVPTSARLALGSPPRRVGVANGGMIACRLTGAVRPIDAARRI